MYGLPDCKEILEKTQSKNSVAPLYPSLKWLACDSVQIATRHPLIVSAGYLREVPCVAVHLKIVTGTYEPPHDKTNKMACAPSEDSDQPGHSPSLIRVFAVRMKKAWVPSYLFIVQRRL